MDLPALSGPRRETASAGFTLIETIIVLVIVAMISAMLLTSYQRILDVRIRLAAFLDGTDAPTLIASWFRDSIEALLPDEAGGAFMFSGTGRRLSGLSTAALDGVPGVPTRIVWELVYDAAAGRTALHYRREDARDMTIASWPGDRGSLRYCDPQLSCSNSWPPSDTMSGGKTSQLPALIVLQAVRGIEDWPIAAAPQSARDPLPKLPDLRGPSS